MQLNTLMVVWMLLQQTLAKFATRTMNASVDDDPIKNIQECI